MALEPAFIGEEAWRETFEGYNIVDCAIRDRDVIYLLLRQALPEEQANSLWDFEIPTRLAVLFLQKTEPKSRRGHQGLADFRKPRCGVSRVPFSQGMAVATNGSVWAMGSKRKGIERVVEDGQPTALLRVRCLFDHAYAVGIHREVYRRVEAGRWERLSEGIPPIAPRHADPRGMFDIGFQDIDGFGADDLYAVGGKSDVWHYDGATWRVCDFLDHWPLFTVCCAPDGNVYVTGEGGTIFQGRGNTWKRIWQDDMVVPYNDSLWFDGKLWLASDYRLDVLEGGQVQRAEHEGERIPASGHMDVADGVLVVAGLETVRLFDGKTWRVLVRPYA
jgi:hypothetical protein